MSLGIYSCNDTYGSRVLVLFDNPDNLRAGQMLMRIDADLHDDDDYSLNFYGESDSTRYEYSVPCTESRSWRLIVPIEHLNTHRHSVARDEGVLLTVLSTFFVGKIDLEHVDAWLDKRHEKHEDGLDRFPRDHVVAEPFASYNSINLREVIMSTYEVALERLKQFGGV